MSKIAVIGTGYVGLVSGTCFSEVGNEVICCDIDGEKIDQLNQGEIPIYEPGLKELVERNKAARRLSFTTKISEAVAQSEIVYIAVGTPMSDTGEADLQYVKAAATTIARSINGYKVIVNKSTVPVGTGELVENIIRSEMKDPSIEFDVVSNPEFLREGTAVKDCLEMERAVIGARSEKAANLIKKLHEPFRAEVLVMDVESAEMTKYASNAFLATKISFINAIANVCDRVGADVELVAKGMGMDSRIGPKFLRAGIGFGGSCFPKDTHALLHIANSVGYDFELIQSVISTNKRQHLVIVDNLKRILGDDLTGKTVSVLGLAFKPDTDDMRDAPSIQIISELLNMGASVKAYDPIAVNEAKYYFGDTIDYYTDTYETLMNGDVALILTEWQQVKDIDLMKAKKLLTQPLIIDGRNCFEPEAMNNLGFSYYSIGRPAVERVKQEKLQPVRM